MSQENVNVVREGFERFSLGDLQASLASFAPEVVIERFSPLPDPGAYHGHNGLAQVLAEWTEDFDEFEMRAEQLTPVGDLVLAQVHQWARGKASGADVEAQFWFVFTISDGQVARLDMYGSEEQGLAAVGLPE